MQDSVDKIKLDRDRMAEYMTTEHALRKLNKDWQKAGEAIDIAGDAAIGIEEGRTAGVQI